MSLHSSPNTWNKMKETEEYTFPAGTQDVKLVNVMHSEEGDWDSGFFDCISCDRPAVCLLACVCPCLVFGEIHDGLINVIDPNTKTTGARCNLAACGYCLLDYPFSVGCALFFTYVIGISVPWLPSLSFCIHRGIRTQIREKNPRNHIPGSSCDDILMTCFLPCCALVQEHKQVFPTPSD